MCTCACECPRRSHWHGTETFGKIKYESCYCARACALPAGTVCAFERREICYRRRTENMKKLPEFVSSWNAKQLFFHLWVFAHAAPWCCCLTDGLLRVGVGGYPIPVPHHCGQTEIYAHCRKQASIHWLQLQLQKSGSPPPRNRSDDQSRKISCVIAQLSERLKQLGVMRKPSARWKASFLCFINLVSRVLGEPCHCQFDFFLLIYCREISVCSGCKRIHDQWNDSVACLWDRVWRWAEAGVFFRVLTNLWKLLVWYVLWLWCSISAVFLFFPRNWCLGRCEAVTDPVDV